MKESVVLGLRYDNEIEIYLTNLDNYFFFIDNESVVDIDMDPLLKSQLKQALYDKYHNIESNDNQVPNEEDNNLQDELANEPLEFNFSDFDEDNNVPTTTHALNFSKYLVDHQISPYTPLSSILQSVESQFNLSNKQFRHLFNEYSKSSLIKPKPRLPISEFFIMIQDTPSNFDYVHIKHKFKNDIRWKSLLDSDRRKYFRTFKKLQNPINLNPAKQMLFNLLIKINCHVESELLELLANKVEYISLPIDARNAVIQQYLSTKAKEQ